MNPNPPDRDSLTRLMDRLRDELRQYGEMLALLDQQQESVMARSAEDVLHSVRTINAQMERIQTAREDRTRCQDEVAIALGGEAAEPFALLLPRLPAAYRPAVEALVRENNELLRRVRRRAGQNHLLLRRSVELMQQFVNSLVPAAPPLTYNGAGQLQTNESPQQPMYQAVG